MTLWRFEELASKVGRWTPVEQETALAELQRMRGEALKMERIIHETQKILEKACNA